ncbi:MAG: 3-keto-disaccharide hydrolase [Henriciella sp.]
MIRRLFSSILPVVALGLSGCISASADDNNGTTPFLPGGEWRVHDSTRPLPPIVTPAPASGDEFAPPPSDAIVLFDGSEDLSAWVPQVDEAELWPVVDGVLMTNASGDRAAEGTLVSGMQTKESYGDVQLHLEFKIPETSTDASGQQYGNSGVYFMGKYEVQVLNSYENVTYADGSAAALYGWKPPLVNASRPPGEWQSYDIVFEAPEFSEDGELTEPAYVTMLHNGVLVHNRQPLLGVTVWRQVAEYEAHEAELPFALQHHGETVHYRNIWLRRLSK